VTLLCGAPAVVAAVLDALRGEVYAALYDAGGGEVLPPRREALDEFVARAPAEALFVGDAAERFGERILALRPGARLRARPAFLAAVVARLVRGPRRGLAMTKDALNRELHMDLFEALENEARVQAELMAEPDFREGFEAFMQRRPARFEGAPE